MIKKRMETLAIKQDPASCLPWDMVQKIAALLPDEDVVALESCSWQWRMICSSDSVWYVLCRRRWPTLFSNGSVLDQLKEQMCVSDPSTKRWKSFYTTRHEVLKATAASIIGGNRNTYKVFENDKDLLASVHFSLIDVELFLFRPHLRVLFNHLGLCYCSKLNVPGKRVVKSLRRCNIQKENTTAVL